MAVDISIIIPVFNNGKYLANCLDSVLGQSFKALEVICIDDASTDRSSEILGAYSSYDSRLRVIRNRRNVGPGPSRNRGIAAAKGRFLRFVDADDLLPIKSTATLYARAILDDVDLVRGSLSLFHGNRPPTYQNIYAILHKMRARFLRLPLIRRERTLRYQDIYMVPNKIHTRLSSENQLWIPWWHTSYLISAKLIRRNNLRYPNLRRGEDVVFMASALVSTEYLSLVGEIVYLYRKYPKASGSASSTIRDVMDTFKHAALTKHLLASHNPNYWYHGYGPFLFNDVQRYLDGCVFDAEQQYLVDREMTKIWGN